MVRKREQKKLYIELMCGALILPVTAALNKIPVLLFHPNKIKYADACLMHDVRNNDCVFFFFLVIDGFFFRLRTYAHNAHDSHKNQREKERGTTKK